MRNRTTLLLRLALLPSLAGLLSVGCVDDTPEPSPPAPQAGVEGEAAELRVSRNASGRVTAVQDRRRRALFRFAGDDPTAAFQAWIERSRSLLGLPAATGEEQTWSLESLDPVEGPDGLMIHRYRQRLHDVEVAGAGSLVSLTSRHGEVISVVGLIADASDVAEEPAAPSEEELDHRALSAAGMGARVVSRKLVALPEKGRMAWQYEVENAEGEHEMVTISNGGGDLIARAVLDAHDAFDHANLLVRGRAMVDDPSTTTLADYPAVGSVQNGTYDPYVGSQVRMGTERLQILDQRRNNDQVPKIQLQDQYFPTGWPNLFAGPNGRFLVNPGNNKFRTQDAFLKAQRALTVLANERSPLTWDYPAGSSLSLFTPAPVALLTNVDSSPESGESDTCGGALGKYLSCDPSLVDGQTPYPNEDNHCIVLCNKATGVLLHELGHHVDQHAGYGIMGSGLSSNTCYPDTTDEALPLRETIADMVGLYLTRKLYPSLTYTFSTTGDPCTFSSAGRGSFAVHHPSCMPSGTSADTFDADRPSASSSKSCQVSAGYRMSSVVRASWAWLNRQFCDGEAPYNCTTPFGRYDVDQFYRAMVYAMSLSNAQSYETFFENMETYIWATDGVTESDRFHDVMVTYGILD